MQRYAEDHVYSEVSSISEAYWMGFQSVKLTHGHLGCNAMDATMDTQNDTVIQILAIQYGAR